MLDNTQRIDLLKQALSSSTNSRDYWAIVQKNLSLLVDSLTMFMPPVQADGSISPEDKRHFTHLAILSTWKPKNFGNLLDAFGENKTVFLNEIFAHTPGSITPFETALLLSPQQTRLTISDICMKHDAPIDALALKESDFYHIDNTIDIGTLQEAFVLGDIDDYFLEQIYHSDPYYHPSFIRLAHDIFGVSEVVLEHISKNFFAKEARIKSLKQELNGFKDPSEYWKIIETGSNLEFILDHIAMFTPPVRANRTLQASAHRYFMPLAIMCTWKPSAFGTLLCALGNNKLNFLSDVLCYTGNSITIFEATLILASSEVCAEINKIYRASAINFQPIEQALNTCSELNQLIYSLKDPQYLSKVRQRFQQYLKKTTLADISSQIHYFPTHYHGPITHLAHTAFNIPLDMLENKLSNFKGCVAYCTGARKLIASITANSPDDQSCVLS